MNALRTVRPGGGSEVKIDINTVQFLAQTDCFVSLDLNVSSQAAGFNLVLSVYVFLSLKAVSPIDCHYMTDRLQKSSFVFCWRNKVTYILDALGVTDKHHIFFFGWTIPSTLYICTLLFLMREFAWEQNSVSESQRWLIWTPLIGHCIH